MVFVLQDDSTAPFHNFAVCSDTGGSDICIEYHSYPDKPVGTALHGQGPTQ